MQARRQRGAAGIRAIVIVVVAILAVTFGWHLLAARDIDATTQEFVTKRFKGMESPEVSVDPVTNVVTVTYRVKANAETPQGLFSALGEALSSALGTAVASMLEPTLERELNLRAREDLDLYAMVLPYRVRIAEP